MLTSRTIEFAGGDHFMAVRTGWIIAAMLALSACSSSGTSTGGSVLGSFAGTAARPSAASASIVAAMGGGLVGAIGPDLSDGEKRRALEAEYQALEYTQGGETVSWQSGRVRGEVVAYQPYRVGSQDCRQYMHTLNEAGPPRSVRGTACRNPNGSWSPLV